jgi:hypothetical protein
MRILTVDVLPELMLWSALVTLVLASFGLAALKRVSRLPPWMARLVAPPFYLVSLPIATLILGAIMVGLNSLTLLGLYLLPYEPWSYIVPFFSPLGALPYDSRFFLFAQVGIFVAFWASIFISGYLLWWTVWREHHRQSLSHDPGQRLRALLLLVCFAWAFVYVKSYLGA